MILGPFVLAVMGFSEFTIDLVIRHSSISDNSIHVVKIQLKNDKVFVKMCPYS